MRSIGRAVLLIVALALVSGVAVAQSPVVDGFLQDPVTGVVEEAYLANGVSYAMDPATGEFAGYLYTAEDGDAFYFGFAQSVHINDNTYGTNAIGWKEKPGHTLKALDRSDHAKIKLYDCGGHLVLEFFLDYATTSKVGSLDCLGIHGGDGVMLFGDPASVLDASSSLDWNFNVAIPTWPHKWQRSPPRVPANTYDPGTTADPDFPWIYELTYEWSVSKAAFTGGCLGALEILEVHNSPYKSGFNPEPVPMLAVSKLSDPPSGSTVHQGSTILYTVTYHNPAPMPLTNVVITDVIDANLADIVPFDGGIYDEPTRTITWPLIPSIPAGGSGFVQFQATVEPISGDETVIYNQAVFTTPDLPTPAKTNVTVHLIEHRPDLALNKSCPAELYSGVEAVYVLSVENLGFGTAESVVLEDVLPPEVALVSATPAPTSQVGQWLSWDLGALPYGAYEEVLITVKATAASGLATNSATVSTPTAEAGAGLENNDDSCVSNVTGPDVYAYKQCPPELVAGKSATYILEIGNSGTATAFNVVATDLLPPTVTFLGSTPVSPSSIDGQTLTWELGDIAPGDELTLIVEVESFATSGSATNLLSVTVENAEGDEGTSNNTSECSSDHLAGDLLVEKACPPLFVAGKNYLYSVEVSNVGTAPLENVWLTDLLPAGVSFVTAAPAPASVVGQEIAFSLGELAVGALVAIDIEVTAEATSGSGINEATGTTDSFEGGAGDSNNADGCESTFVAPQLTVDKECPPDMVSGEFATYSVTVANGGTSAAKNVVLTDTLPAGVIFWDATPGPDLVFPGLLVFFLGDLDAGLDSSVEITVVANGTSGSVTNAVDVMTDSPEGGAGDTDNADSCSSNILAPDLEVIKSCDLSVIAGEVVTYTIDVSNLGDAPAKNVIITDTLPPEVEYKSANPPPDGIVGSTLFFNLGELGAGGTAQIAIDVSVIALSGTATNVATGSTDSKEGGLGTENNSDGCDSGVLAPDIGLIKTCPEMLVAGEEASFWLQVSNSGTAIAKNVVVTDTLPPGVTYVSAVPTPDAIDGQVLTFNMGHVAPGETPSISIKVNVDATSGSLTNNGLATTDSLEGGFGESNNAAQCASTVLSPDLHVDKTCAEFVVSGKQATYFIVVNNFGMGSAKNVVVTDTLPAGVTYLSALPLPDSIDGQKLTFNIGDLGGWTMAFIQIEVTVDALAGPLLNEASAETDSMEGGAGDTNNVDSCASEAISPDVTLDKECPPELIAGEMATYTISVGNTGSTPAENVVVTDTLPAGVTYDSASPVPDFIDGQVLTFNMGTINDGETKSITIDVTTWSVSGSELNDAAATTDSVEGGAGDTNNADSCSSTVLAPDLVVVKDCPPDIVAGEVATYTVTVENIGTSVAKSVTLNDTLPDGVAYKSATPGYSSKYGQVLEFFLGDLAVGESSTVTIEVKGVATEGELENQAAALTSSTEGGEGSINNFDLCTSTARAPDITVEKSCDWEVISGAQTTYSITVSNHGTSPAKNVVLVDSLPSGVSFVSSVPSPDDGSGNDVVFELGELDVGASTTVTIEVLVTALDGQLTNRVDVYTSSIEGGDAEWDNWDECPSNVLATDIRVEKECWPPYGNASWEYTFNTYFYNDGTTTAHDVVVTDLVPAGFFQGDSFTPWSDVGVITVDGLTITVNVGDLAPGAMGTLSVTGTVTPSSAARGDYSTYASCSTSSAQTNLSNDKDQCTVTLQAPVLSLSKTATFTKVPAEVTNEATVSAVEIIQTASDSRTDTVTAATDITYTITVSNSGDLDATGVLIVDTLPDGVEILANPDGGVVDDFEGTVTWTLSGVTQGESESVTLTVRPILP